MPPLPLFLLGVRSQIQIQILEEKILLLEEEMILPQEMNLLRHRRLQVKVKVNRTARLRKFRTRPGVAGGVWLIVSTHK
jgi:hypothetical protein